jgi:lipopolysaccharide biosynthesis regulator YciM
LDLAEARGLLRAAAPQEGDNPHVHLAASVLATAGDDAVTAAARLADAIAAAPELSSFLVPLLYDAHVAELEAGGGAEGADVDPESSDADARAAERTAAVLEEIVSRVGREPHLLLSLAEMRSHFAPDRALEDYRAIAGEHRDLLPARLAAARLALAGAEAGEIQAELRAMVDAEGAFGWASEGTWRCEKCGHRDDRFFWRCARCRAWGQVRRDLGRAAQDPEPPRDRREALRPLALPAPAIDIAAALTTRREEASEATLLSRASGALSGVWRTIRSRRPPGA